MYKEGIIIFAKAKILLISFAEEYNKKFDLNKS